MHFYNFNIGDYAKKTQHLTNEEDLAYRRLLDLYYDIEAPITHGLATLTRRLRVSEKALQNVLDEFFPGGKNKHADEEIAKYYAYLEKQKANGIKGGRPKHKPTANPPVSQNNPPPSQPRTINQEPRTKKTLTPLSGKSDVTIEILEYLNKKTGCSYKPVEANLKLIRARLAEGATREDVIRVIDRQNDAWPDGSEMRKYLRPATLFNATKFAQYLGAGDGKLFNLQEYANG